MREPTVARWPGKIPAGIRSDEIMTTMDLLPTFAKLAGAGAPTDRVIDGKDIWLSLVGEAATPHEAFFYHQANMLTAVRAGKWKLHLTRSNNNEKTLFAKSLYNLEADVGETTDVLAAHSDIEKRLLSYIETFEAELAENSRPAGFVDEPKPLSVAGQPQTKIASTMKFGP